MKKARSNLKDACKAFADCSDFTDVKMRHRETRGDTMRHDEKMHL